MSISILKTRTVKQDTNKNDNDPKQLIRREKNRIKKMKKKAIKQTNRDQDLQSSLQEQLQNINNSRDLLQRKLNKIGARCKFAQDKLIENQKLFESVQINRGQHACENIDDDDDNRMQNFKFFLSYLESEARRAINSQQLLQKEFDKMTALCDALQQKKQIVTVNKISSNYSNLDMLLIKQELLCSNGILCTRFEISERMTKKCTCKKKNKCKPYFHENILEDSIFYTFAEKNNTFENIRLAKIMKQLILILSQKNCYTFEFDIDNESYNIEFIWSQNDIIYLVQSNICIDGNSKFLFDKRWIKITI
jgi:hypothetical protein